MVSFLKSAALACGCLASVTRAYTGDEIVSDPPKIDTVVVMMLENRAFDHMLGFMSRGGPFGDTRVDGLTGTECNPTKYPGQSTAAVVNLPTDF